MTYNPFENETNQEASAQQEEKLQASDAQEREPAVQEPAVRKTEPQEAELPQKTDPAAPGFGTAASPYTFQTGGSSNSPVKTETEAEKPAAAPSPYAPQPTYSARPDPAYRSPYQPTHSPYQPSQAYRSDSAYRPSNIQPQQQPRPQQQQQPQSRPAGSAYTWNPQGSPASSGTPYYQPVQVQKKKAKKHGGRIALRVLAAVLACAVVSFGSVGAFALMIQNGLVNIQSTGDSSKTAAFTIYKQAEESVESTPTVSEKAMSAQEVAKKLIPSVVCVQNYQITRQQDFYFGFGGFEDDDSGAEVSPAGEGSGIIISKDGYIVTNQHVVANATSLKVVTSEGLSYEAELVGEDTQTDLAVIKINAETDLSPAEFGSSQDLEVADEVMAIGNPGGLQLNSSVTFGKISALNRQVTDSETGYSMTCIQTDAAINPGNSGGALVDMNGHVVGINSSKIVATEYEGLGFAIPADTAQPIVSDLIEFGYVKDRPMLGISGQYIDRMTASFYGLSSGYYVAKISSESAAQSGLQRGDVIIAIDDTQITSGSTISSYIAGKKPGETVTLTVDRALSGESNLKIELVLSENTGEAN